MKKKSRVSEKPITKAQIHQHEFHRDIKDLSTDALEYRFTENLKYQAAIGGAIAEFEGKLKAARAELSKTLREGAVLSSAIEGRR